MMLDGEDDVLVVAAQTWHEAASVSAEWGVQMGKGQDQFLSVVK